MAKVSHLISNFTGGELSPRLNGRVDITKYQNGARAIQNATVVPHGGARKRPGSKFIIPQRNTSDDVVLIPFQYSTTQAYVLVVGPSYIWFLKDQGIITNTAKNITGITQANPAVVTSASHGFSNGDIVYVLSVAGMTQVNNRIFTVANATTNTFELSGVNSSGYDAYTSGGTAAEPVALNTTYTADELEDLQFAQINDVMYIAHRSHALAKLSRTSDTAWTLSEPDITTGPFRSINETSTRFTPSSFSSSVNAYGTHLVGETFTLTASAAYFTSDMVGALIRLNEEGGESGVFSAPVGDATVAISNAQVYTNEGYVYGVSNVATATTWEPFTRVPAHDSGTVRVQSGTAGTYFDANFLHPTYCIVRITAYASSTSVTCQIVRYHMPASIVSSGTTYWEEGAWSDERGYPGAIAVFEQRLWLGGNTDEPSTIWSTRVGSYENFEDGTQDDNAIVYRLVSGSADVVRWLRSGRILTAGTSSGEYAIAASSQNEALTPSNVSAKLQATYGTSAAQPVQFNQSVLYPQRSGNPANAAKKLREFTYSFAADAYESIDLSIFAEHIFGAGFDEIDYQLEPDSIVWCRRTDGKLAACTYEKLQEVVAWHRHIMGGTNSSVKSICVIPGDSGDDLYLSVARTINGGTVRYLEVLQQAFNDQTDVKEDGWFLDGALRYEGSATDTITGLWHLEGETVTALNNGALEENLIVTNGSVTLERDTTKCLIGLPFETIIETVDLEAGAKMGTSQSRMKRISQIYVRLLNSMGGSAGPDADTQRPFVYRTPSDLMDDSPSLYSGLMELTMNSFYDREGVVRIEHNEPFPLFVTGIVAEINTAG